MVSRKFVCVIDEYVSIRFMLVWVIVMIELIIMVRIVMIYIIGV